MDLKSEPRGRFAWLGSEPARIWPVIMPGMETMPTTFIWLSVGIMATRMHLRRAVCVASHLPAPSASSSSMYCLPARKEERNVETYHSCREPGSVVGNISCSKDDQLIIACQMFSSALCSSIRRRQSASIPHCNGSGMIVGQQ